MTELQIRYFFEVVNRMSFSKAARALYVSQPSISVQITALEEELGFALFDRSKKAKMNLTPAGRVFFDGMQIVSRIVDDTISKAQGTSQYEAMSVRIGLVEGWRPLELMNHTIRHCYAEFPNSEVHFESDSFRNLHTRLMNDELDVILTVQTTLPLTNRMRIEHVTDLDATLFFSKNHVLCHPGRPELLDFVNDTMYVLPVDETPLSRDINKGYLISQKMNPPVVEKPTRDSLLLQLMFADGFAIFDNWTTVDPEFRTMKLEHTIPICTVELSGQTKNPLVEIFHEELTRYVNKY